MAANGLTFEQVKQARVFAWNERGYLWVDGRLLHIQAIAERDPMHAFRVSSLKDHEVHVLGLWFHLADCDCQFCRQTKA